MNEDQKRRMQAVMRPQDLAAFAEIQRHEIADETQAAERPRRTLPYDTASVLAEFNEPSTPVEVAERTGLVLNHVRGIVGSLRKSRLIADAGMDGSEHVYKITADGRRADADRRVTIFACFARPLMYEPYEPSEFSHGLGEIDAGGE